MNLISGSKACKNAFVLLSITSSKYKKEIIMFLLAASQAESAQAAAADPALSQAAASAGAVGGIVAASLTTIVIIELIWLILQIIADWKIFHKAGEGGWKSIIPILNTIVEYDICWSGFFGLLFLVMTFLSSFMAVGTDAPAWKGIVAGVCGIIALVLHIIQSFKLSKVFGHGIGLGLVLLFLGPIGRLILGFGGSEYVGKQD